MLPAAGAVFAVAFWVIVFVADSILRGKQYASRYRKFLERTGLTVSFLQIKSYTRYFNKFFIRVGKMPGNIMLIWFNLGMVFGGIAMVSSLVILMVMLQKNLTEEEPEQLLTPIIPGVNIPWRHVIYYFFTLAIGGTLHEVGHAIAASRESVRVMGFGWFVLPIFCGAYVELQTDHLQVVSAVRQLRIYCAGVWHNFVSASIAVGCWWLFPYAYLLLYDTNKGAVVSEVFKESTLHHNLRRGDQILLINNCSVKSTQDYAECLQKVVTLQNPGYCHNINSISRRNTSLPHLTMKGSQPECCSGSSPSRFCFSHVIHNHLTHSCLPARYIVVNKPQCSSNLDCKPHPGTICVSPVTSNDERFVKISHVKGPEVLFVGNPYELFYHVSVSNYLSNWSLIPLDIPDYIQTFLIYFASLSGALAILNMIPCYCLDGQWALMAFIEYFLPRIIKSSSIRALIYHSILFSSFVLLVTNIMFAFWNLRGQGVLAMIFQRSKPD